MNLLSQLNLKSLNNEFHLPIFLSDYHIIFSRINVLFNVFLFRIKLRILFRIFYIEIDVIILLFDNTIVCKFNYNVYLIS